MEAKTFMKKITLATLILVLLTLSACGPTSVLTTDPEGPPDDQYVTTSCVPIFSSAPGDIKPKGMVVLHDYKVGSHLFMLNLENGRQTPLETWGESVSDIFMSPDRKALAYKIGHPTAQVYNMVVSDAQGNPKKDIPLKREGFFIMKDWINNEEILVANGPLVAFNPYTNTKKGFSFSDFPGYSDDPISGNRYATFDSTLAMVLYKNTNGKMSLLDMSTKKILGEVDNLPAPYPIAAWSPDDSQIAVVSGVILGSQEQDIGNDIFTISRDGHVKRLTHLADHYGKLFTISSPSSLRWSPDGRSIAFWLLNPKNIGANWQFVVFDTVTQKTTNYCIPSSSLSNLIATHQLPPPIWSEDGTQIMLENRYDKDNTRVVILDLTKKVAFQVIDNMYPAAWMFP
jgi:Tol biopolymer transport system component